MKEGFRWSAINGTRSTNDLKFCYKSKSVNDVQGMSLCCATEAITSQYITAICNADFISKYTEGFVNSTVIFQINDCRQIPIIIPTNEELKEFENLFEEGFCWNNLLNPNARLLKVKLKGESVNDVGSMSLYTTNILSNKYIVALLNSNILFDYYREFINCSVNVQINDIKQLPIIIPTKSLASSIELWADKAIKKKQESANENLEPIEVEIEDLIKILYSI